MSSPFSSESQTPYKSRLFNFFNRQFININERVGKKARQLKLGLKWGIQALLYPIYLLVQTGRMTGRQLKSAFQGNPLELNPLQNQEIPSLPDPDRPITIILSKISQENTIPSLANVNLQGFAINLHNNHLVLVNSHNQIIDILSLQQQKNLSLFIRDVRADYWEQKRIATIKRNKLGKVFPNIKVSSNQNIIPLTLFWQLMAWVQKSSLAVSLNVFGESKYISSSELKQIFPLQETEKKENMVMVISRGILTNIDNTVANLEKGNLFEFNHQNLAVNNSAHSNGIDIEQENNNFLTQDQKQNFSIQVLIQLAIDYFFGEPKNQTKVTGDNSKALLPSTKPENLLLKNNQKNPQPFLQNYHQLISKISENIKSIAENIKSSIDGILPKFVNRQNSLTVKSNNISGLNNLPKNKGEENLAVGDNLQQQNDPFQIQALIWAAIDYFFNKKKTFLSSSSPSHIVDSKTNNNSKKLESSGELIIEESWLSWDDLYGNNLDKSLSNLSSKGKKQEQKSAKKIKDLTHNFPDNKNQVNGQDFSNLLPKKHPKLTPIDNSKFSDKFLKNKPKKNFRHQSPSHKKLLGNKNLSKNKNAVINSVHDNLKTKANQRELENKPDWLETSAVNLGNERHFLQVILEWIDRIILWLEEFLIKIFRKLR
jgi:hypothetical protein